MMLTAAFNETETAIQNAWMALRRGEKSSARHWAQRAAQLNPTREEPWLILAAVSNPRASIAYLNQALKINPDSREARKGLQWAIKRPGTAPKKPVSRPLPDKSIHKGFAIKSLSLIILPLALIAFASAAVLLAGVFFPNLNGFAIIPVKAQAEISIAKSTQTPTAFLPLPSATRTPFQPPTYTPSPTITPVPSDTPTPLPSPEVYSAPVASSRKMILVDISEQHLYAYDGDVLMYSFVASTGMNNSTRAGTFSVLNKIDNAYGATWNIWMPDWMGIYWAGSLQNGIHALPILSNGNRLWAGYLGTPISFGCIVLGVEESQLLYDWAEVGTTVVIQR
jgi:lipoprotein-anchoring transpeptidase ErfK/SrfK